MFERPVYIASYLKTDQNDNGADIDIYDTPQRYLINFQPVSDYLAYQEYGQDVSSVKRALVRKELFYGKVKQRDKVYLNDENNPFENLCEVVESETERCLKANYEVIKAVLQGYYIRIDIRKIKKRG